MPLRDAHAALGALCAERNGRTVVLSYGAAASEYRAARDGAAVVDLSERGVLEVTGPQRQRFLQGMLSNEVASRRPGEGCRAALLTAKGAVQALLRVLVEPSSIVLETDIDRLEPVVRTFEHHRVAAPVRFASPPTAVLALLGPRTAEVALAVGAPPPPEPPESHVRAMLAGSPVRLVRAGDLPGRGLLWHVPSDGVGAAFEALRSAGATPIGREALDVLRIEASKPWWGTDVSDANLLHETGLVAECHSPSKGCYLGQEIIARLEGRGGHVNKALRTLKLAAPAHPGDTIQADGREVGRISTAAVSPRFGPIALGYVHRSHFAPGTALEVAGAPATVVAAFEDER